MPEGPIRTLFPQTVVIRDRRIPGDPAELHPAEAEHVARAVPKRLAEFAAGRACARAALAEFGVRDFALRAAPDRQPLWPDGFIGTITHTAGFCAAAVASRASILAIGLDSEIVGAPTLDIWPTIARSEELAWVRSLPACEQPAAITLLFAVKEALYKCQYPLVGEWLDFHDLRVEAGGWGNPAGTFAVSATRSIRFARRVALPIVGRYLFHEHFVSAAVAVPANSSQ
jgi:enterobactin synthetase component D / holo-[acyl-carrier protein] synthase